MPFSPDQIKALSDLGGFALFLATIILAVLGIWRRWVVPGWLFDEEHRARVSAELENRVLSVSVARLTAELKALRDERKRDGHERA
jgi:hypothetical protein